VYDGKVCHPEEPVELTPETRVRVTIEAVEAVKPQPQAFLKTARALRLEGPSDWSTRGVKDELSRSRPMLMSEVFLDTAYAIALSSPKAMYH
jgi:hypothetical protein